MNKLFLNYNITISQIDCVLLADVIEVLSKESLVSNGFKNSYKFYLKLHLNNSSCRASGVDVKNLLQFEFDYLTGCISLCLDPFIICVDGTISYQVPEIRKLLMDTLQDKSTVDNLLDIELHSHMLEAIPYDLEYIDTDTIDIQSHY